MKILPLKFSFSFTSYATNKYTCCDDDWGTADDIDSAKLRDALRERMYSQFLTYDNYDKKVPDYAKTLDDVYILNLQNIGANSYKGATLANNIDYLDLLKHSNVSTVIDLAAFNNLRAECKQRNIGYYRYTVTPDFWANPIFADNQSLLCEKICELQEKALTKEEFSSELDKFKTKIMKERADFMKNFEELLSVMSQGNFYISCELGENRTPNILALNTYFNPNWHGDKIQPTRGFVKNCIKNMYNNLTVEDKAKLGFTEEFEDELRENLHIKTGKA